MRRDGQTDVTKVTVAFCTFANVPKSPRSANRLRLRVINVFVTQTESVYCAVRTESLYKIKVRVSP